MLELRVLLFLGLHDLKWCEVQLGYAIGVAQPISVCVKNDKGLDLSNEVRENYPLTPRGIINKLCLAEKDYERQPSRRKTV